MRSEIHEFESDLRWSELPAQYVIYMQALAHWWPTSRQTTGEET